MVLEDKVQQFCELLLERIRRQTEQEVRGFVSELLTAAAKERATTLDNDRRVAESERQKAVREEGARVRAEVEKTWAAKLRETNDAVEQQCESGLRTVREEATRQLAQEVASVRGEGQRVLEAALEAARREADRTLLLRIEQVRGEAELAAVAARSTPEPAPAEP